jgi:hypothetical protein
MNGQTPMEMPKLLEGRRVLVAGGGGGCRWWAESAARAEVDPLGPPPNVAG